MKRLTDMGRGVERFYERIEPLSQAGKLGPVLWQLPGNFHRDDDRLAAALAAAAAGRHCFEFRHASWFTDEVYDAAARARRGAGDRRPPGAPVPDPRADGRLDLHPLPLRHAAGATATTPTTRARASGRRGSQRWRAAVEVFAYFNNDWNGYAVRNALALQAR